VCVYCAVLSYELLSEIEVSFTLQKNIFTCPFCWYLRFEVQAACFAIVPSLVFWRFRLRLAVLQTPVSCCVCLRRREILSLLYCCVLTVTMSVSCCFFRGFGCNGCYQQCVSLYYCRGGLMPFCIEIYSEISELLERFKCSPYSLCPSVRIRFHLRMYILMLSFIFMVHLFFSIVFFIVPSLCLSWWRVPFAR